MKKVIIKFEKEFKERILEVLSKEGLDKNIIKEKNNYYKLKLDEAQIRLLRKLKPFISSIEIE